MKNEVKLGKFYFLVVIAISFIIGGVVGIFAYGAPPNWNTSNPARFGHSVDEVDWGQKIKGNVSADGFCIGASCITAWPTGGGGGGVTKIIAGSGVSISPTTGIGDVTVSATGVSSQWTTSGNNIYYNSGNVGIGTSSPAAMLEVDGKVLVKGAPLCIGASPSSMCLSGSSVILNLMPKGCGGGISNSATCTTLLCNVNDETQQLWYSNCNGNACSYSAPQTCQTQQWYNIPFANYA